MNRSKKASLNLSSQLLLQFVTAICGFIVPKLVLESFGSEVNGITASIAQFLGILSLMEAGFGAVAKSAFYKKIAAGDSSGISGVFNASERFFHKVAFVFLAYCILLSFGFPLLNGSGFGYFFVLSLILIIGIGMFVQYYFGMTYTLLLNADQKGYISAFGQTVSIILNAFVTLLLLKLGASIHIVKLVSAFVFFLRPAVVVLYCRKKYVIDRRVPQDECSVAQKWDNFGQSIATYVHTKTSYVFITLFLSFLEVSIYSVYSLVTTSLSSIITGISTGFVSGLGNIYANHEKENFKRIFSLYEFVNHFFSFAFYTIAVITIIPFVKIYTGNLSDSASYILPLFSVFIIISELVYCLRLPYYYAITNAGHFKQITKSAYIEVGINIAISLTLVLPLGLMGLAISSGVSMLYRTAFLAFYCSKNIANINVLCVVKRIVLFAVPAAGVAAVGLLMPYSPGNFAQWILYAVVVSACVFLVLGCISLLFFRGDMKTLFQKVKSAIG